MSVFNCCVPSDRTPALLCTDWMLVQTFHAGFPCRNAGIKICRVAPFTWRLRAGSKHLQELPAHAQLRDACRRASLSSVSKLLM